MREREEKEGGEREGPRERERKRDRVAEKEQMKEQTRQDVENHQEEKKNRNIQRTGTYRERYEGQMTEILSHISSIEFEIDTMRMSGEGLEKKKEKNRRTGKERE